MNAWERNFAMACLLVILAKAGAVLAVEPDPLSSVPIIKGPLPGSAEREANAAGSRPAAGVGEMREWLSRRNLERKGLGLAGPSSQKSHFPELKSPYLYPRPKPLKEPGGPIASRRGAMGERGGDFQPGRSEPILHIGQGPDGRIHHRYILREDGPDQFEIYSGMGYNPVKPETDAQKWARLTPRGRKLWFGASAWKRSPAKLAQRPTER